MKNLAATLAIAALLTATGAVAATPSKPYEGTVRSVDAASNTVTLEDGTIFRVGEGVEVDGLDPGTRVIFWYHTYDGRKTVVSYELPDTGTVSAAAPQTGQ